MTRGERNNNPGNIRLIPGVIWKGEASTQTDGAFVQFTDAQYGIRAIARIMRSYEREGLQTLSEIINRWAPPNENNSQAYVSAVCSDCSKPPDEPIDFDALMPQLVKAIIRHENGEVIYTDEQIEQGVSLT